MTATHEVSTRELAELVETGKIERVLFDYAYNLDMNRPDDLVDLFTEDCYVAYGPTSAPTAAPPIARRSTASERSSRQPVTTYPTSSSTSPMI